MSSVSYQHKVALDAALTKVLKSNFDAESKICFTTLLKLLDNVLKQPDNAKVRSIRLSNKAIHTKIVQCQGVDVLLACGFEEEQQHKIMETQGESMLVLAPEKEETTLLVQARRMIQLSLVEKLNVASDDIPAIPTPGSRNEPFSGGAEFNVYEGRRYDGKSASVGTSLNAPDGWKSQTEKQVALLQQKQQRIEDQFRKKAGREIDRQWSVTSPTDQPLQVQASAVSTAAQASDTALLAKHAQKQAMERQAAENRGFTTKAMRDLEQLKKKKVYSHAVLAVRFPDGYTIRGNFWPSETISTVIQHLRSDALIADTADFDLYVTPPRTLLTPSKSLQDLGLAPAAKVHVSWKTAVPRDQSPGWYINRSILSKNNGSGTALPESVSLDKDERIQEKSKSTGATSGPSTKRKKTKAEKEADLLKRMMGK